MANKPEIMIDIGNSNTKVVAYKGSGSSLTVLDFTMFSTPDNMFNEDEALVMSAEFLYELKKAVSDMKIKPASISFTISSPSIIMREITLPKVDGRQLKTMINLEIPQHFMIDVKDFSIDYKILGTKIVKDSEVYDVMLVAAPLSIVESYLLMAQSCGYPIKKLDFCSSSIGKLEIYENYSPAEDNKTYAFVDIGHNQINVSIEKRGALMYSRNLSLGCTNFRQAIDSVDECGYEETINTLKSYDILRTSASFENKTPLDTAMAEISGSIVESLVRIFDFHISRELNNQIDKIILLGGGSNMVNIDAFFSNALSIETERLPEIKSIKVEKYTDDFQAKRSYYANCIGAAL